VIVSLAIGFFWAQLVQFFPRGMTAIVTVLSILSLTAVGIIVLIDKSETISGLLKISIGGVTITLAILFAFFLCFYRRRNRLTGVFIDWGTKLAKENLSFYIFTLFFIVLTAGLIVLCLFQHLAFLSHSEP
jgi:hypothetical protein